MSAIPVFFCEMIGHRWRLHGWCECGAAVPDHVYPDGRGHGDYEEVWPGPACAACGAAPKISSRIGHAVYRRHGSGAVINPDGATLPAGAVYALDQPHRTGPDGRYLICVMPGGHHWHIDGRASNCTMKDDEAHRCWVRHGRPEDGSLHVDKNGLTCQAGAGSIALPNWHGFLHGGALRQC